MARSTPLPVTGTALPPTQEVSATAGSQTEPSQAGLMPGAMATGREALTLRGGIPLSELPNCYLGVDPGLARTGYAVLERRAQGPHLREGGVVRTSPRLSLPERVFEICTGIREVIDEFQPQVLAIEQLFSMVRNPKTAILMAHARGVILLAAAEKDIPVIHYTPRQVKRLLTGSGRASKEQIQRATQAELQLDKPLEPNDVADACAVALCHYHTGRFVM